MSTEDQIIKLAKDGMRRGEIANTVGCSIHTVYFYIYEARKSGIFIPKFKKGTPKWSQLTIPNAAAKKLRRAARARNLTPSQLAERLLSEMKNGNLIAAVLDDGIGDV